MSVPGSLARRLVAATALMWLAIRVALSALGVVQVSALGMVSIAAVVLAAAWLDMRRNVELYLHANLAVSPLLISLLVLTVALALEAVASVPIAILVPTAGEAPLP